MWYVHVSVCVCVCACVRACVRACACVLCLCVMCMSECVYIYIKFISSFSGYPGASSTAIYRQYSGTESESVQILPR